MWIINVIILSTCLLQIQCTRLKRQGPSITNPLSTATGALGAAANPLDAATGALGTAGNPLGAATGALGTGANPLGTATGALGTATGALNTATGTLGTGANAVNAVTGAASSAMGPAAGALGSATTPAGPITAITPANFAAPSSATNIQPSDSSSLYTFSSLLQNIFQEIIKFLTFIIDNFIRNSPGKFPASNSSPPQQLPPIGGKREVSEIYSIFQLRNQIQNYKNKNSPECNVYSICIARDLMPMFKVMVERLKPNEEAKAKLSELEALENKIEDMFPISDGFCSAVHKQCSLSN